MVFTRVCVVFTHVCTVCTLLHVSMCAAGDTLLDRIMAQIPGKDNYVGNIEDSALGRTKYEVGDGSQVLNTAFYHRWYKIGEVRITCCCWDNLVIVTTAGTRLGR